MNITFQNPEFDDMIEKILEFQGKECSEFWSEPLYNFYPQLDREYAKAFFLLERRQYLEQTMRSVYGEIKEQDSAPILLNGRVVIEHLTSCGLSRPISPF